MAPVTSNIEELGVNVIRGIAMDAPQAAGNGHPGTAMALAPLAHVLFTRVMVHDPKRPDWPDRDRFVLSCGHASILQYALLYLCGYGLTLEDLRRFRQLGSRTPGHPEVHHTAGVEVTTGPLGQGFANAVGMAVAEQWVRATFGADVSDHRTFVVCSDGDLQEGISHEAASLAGHLGLGRLICVFDDNHITIDGDTDLSCSDDVAARFTSYGWHVENLGEVANDLDAIEAGLRRGIAVEDKPTLLLLRSHIGWPSPNKTDSASAHGEALGADEIRATKEILGLPVDETFHAPIAVVEHYRLAQGRGAAARADWERRIAAFSGDRSALDAALAGGGLAGWETKLPSFETGAKVATRNALKTCLDAVADVVPGMVAGGADLTGNTGVKLATASRMSRTEPGGRQLHFGIREHAMASSANGMAMHGGVLPVTGTFFVFSDYMRPAIRLAAISQAKVIHALSHDSVALGNDGPTHQPIEQLASLRAMPGLRVLRPADANETAHALRIAIDSTGPTALVLSRQDLPVLDGTHAGFEGVSHGAYVLRDVDDADITLVGTGSEVTLCIAAATVLSERGTKARVVSMPSWDLFAAQTEEYRSYVIDPDTPTLAVEAAASFGWERWADDVVAIDRFGASGPGDEVMASLGFTPDNVAARAAALLEEWNAE
ncbi:MAG TPA: transketolase [Acidimicrobiales bacterium]|nr:transketolase [Acidimicrobiales bacterium]